MNQKEKPVSIPTSPIKSSNVAACGYDEKTQTLAVTFKHGDTYHYSGVSVEAHEELTKAKSFGKHFMANIRGNFPHEKL